MIQAFLGDPGVHSYSVGTDLAATVAVDRRRAKWHCWASFKRLRASAVALGTFER